MEFTKKELIPLLKVSKQALSKSLKGIPYTLKTIEGSTKPVEHYKHENLPDRYKAKLGLREEPITTNISQAKFTQKYLLADPTKKKKATQKCKLIDFYLKRRSTMNQKQWLESTLKNSLDFEELGNVSIKQLNDWLNKYKEAQAKGLNLVEIFIDNRGAAKGTKALDAEQQATAIRYFLKANRPMMSEVHRNMCHTYGDTMCSYDTLNDFYKEWKRKNPMLHEFSKSPDSAKNKFLAAYGSMSAKAKYKNQYWELDSTPADIICEDGKRYAIMAALDIYSRRVVFHVSETSSAYSISQLLRKAIIKLGIPENVVIDNGKDYTSNHFESMCLGLGINMEIVPPFSGECKPHVERVFGTLSSELFEQFPGYIGHNVAQRSEIQARKSFADKIKSQEKWREEQKLRTEDERAAWRDAWKLKKENIGLDLSVLISADELQVWIDNWTNKFYEQRVHGGIKTKPIQKWNADMTPVESIADERMLCLLLGESATRKVGKKGIAFDGCQYAHMDLINFAGQTVYVMASEDLGYIYVFDENMNYICAAEDLEHMGEDRQAVKKARKQSLKLMHQMDKIVKAAENIKDVSIMDRIEDVIDVVESKTTAVHKRTTRIDALLKEAPKMELKDKEELEKSNKYDFKNKDEKGKPQKILESGRPMFKTFIERFVWDLEHDSVDESTNNLAKAYPDMWEMAKKQAKVG